MKSCVPFSPRELEPLLPKITVRTLITWGAHDQVVDPSSVNVFTALMPNTEQTIFAECGHALYRECPDLLARRYLAFLEREPADDDRMPSSAAAREGHDAGFE